MGKSKHDQQASGAMFSVDAEIFSVKPALEEGMRQHRLVESGHMKPKTETLLQTTFGRLKINS